jgi:hypothetical protein
MDAQMRLPTQKTKNLRKISEHSDSEQNCGTNSSSIDPHLEDYANSDSFSSEEGYLLWLKDNDPDEYEEYMKLMLEENPDIIPGSDEDDILNFESDQDEIFLGTNPNVESCQLTLQRQITFGDKNSGSIGAPKFTKKERTGSYHQEVINLLSDD